MSCPTCGPSLAGEWGCEYCGATFDTCSQLALHIKDQHPGQAFPNCCDSDADCQTLYGAGWVCSGGVCVQLTETYPMLISAETVPDGVPISLQLAFTINGVTKYTPYAESLAAGSYRLVFPQTVTIDSVVYTILGNNDFTVTHPQNGETYFKASYFSDLPPPPIRVRFNSTAGGLVDWGEGPQEYGSMLVDPGSNVQVLAIPDAGYRFAFWRKNNVKASERNPAVFSVDIDETRIDAIFVVAGFDWMQLLPWIILGGGLLLILTRRRD